jgi:aspartyl-tRNA(Asn)/glutamyl-tRNA(Gln) amidotransferase subunit A
MNRRDNSVLNWNLMTLSKAYKEKKISPTEVIQLIFQRIKETNDTLNAYITVCYDTAMKEAKQTEKEFHKGTIKGPLHGVHSIKRFNLYKKHQNNNGFWRL